MPSPAPVVPTPHTPLPPAPQTDDQVNFDARADDFVAAQEPYGDELDAIAATTYQNALGAYNNAVEVAANTALAQAAAASALNAPGTLATSSTNMTIGIGSKTFTLDQTGKAYGKGQRVTAAISASPTNLMSGVITAVAGTSLTVNFDYVPLGSAGSATAWDISLGAPPAPQVMTYSAQTAAYTVTAADLGRVIEATSGTWTLTLPNAVNAGSGFYFFAKINNANGVITIAPVASQTIGGATTLLGYRGEMFLIQSDGANWRYTKITQDDGPQFIARDERASGFDYGSVPPANTWTALGLTTVVRSVGWASNSGGAITLQPGTYQVRASGAFGNVNNGKTRLYNVTDSVEIVAGTGARAGSSTSPSWIVYEFTITSAKTVRLESWFSGTGAATTFGQAQSSGSLEVYATLELTRR